MENLACPGCGATLRRVTEPDMTTHQCDRCGGLLLERGEFVIMSSPLDNPAIECTEIAKGEILAILPEGHRLAAQSEVSINELMQEPLVGIDPADPYGAILAQPFADAGIVPRHTIRGRFAQTVVSLVRHGLGVGLIDEFSVAEVYMPGVVRVRLNETTPSRIYVATKKGRVISSFAEDTIKQFRKELAEARVHWQAP